MKKHLPIIIGIVITLGILGALGSYTLWILDQRERCFYLCDSKKDDKSSYSEFVKEEDIKDWENCYKVCERKHYFGRIPR
jgi:hypothetical protein